MAANAPLVGVIPAIRQQIGGFKWTYVRKVLEHKLTTSGDEVLTSFHPTSDTEGNVRICPRDIIGGEFGSTHGKEMAVRAVSVIALTAVEHTIEDLNQREERRRR